MTPEERLIDAGDELAVLMLSVRAEDMPRSNDAGFWILTSAAAHLRGHHDDEGSTVAHYFPEWARVAERKAVA